MSADGFFGGNESRKLRAVLKITNLRKEGKLVRGKYGDGAYGTCCPTSAIAGTWKSAEIVRLYARELGAPPELGDLFVQIYDNLPTEAESFDFAEQFHTAISLDRNPNVAMTHWKLALLNDSDNGLVTFMDEAYKNLLTQITEFLKKGIAGNRVSDEKWYTWRREVENTHSNRIIQSEFEGRSVEALLMLNKDPSTAAKNFAQAWSWKFALPQSQAYEFLAKIFLKAVSNDEPTQH